MARRPVLENAVMEILWDDGGWLGAGEVRARLDREVALSTVATVLGRLLHKGRVERRPSGRAFRYRATLSREDHVAEQMREVLAISHDRDLALMRFIEQLPGSDRSRLRRRLRRRRE